MTKEERDHYENVKRIGTNLGVLLDVGLFPGQHALGLQECKGMVKAFVDDAMLKLQTLTPPPAVVPPAPSSAPAAA